ncbi:MAG: mechanosensitive ion channel [Oscillospiraceae bacterium]|nr:mechanosensitive ion channel [Oscillospiraceae bacterium]
MKFVNALFLTQNTETEIEAAISQEAEEVSTLLTGLLNFIKSILPSVGSALLVLFIGVMLAKALMKIIKRTLKRTTIDPTAGSFLTSVISVLLYVIVAVIVLSVLNVPMDSIVTVIGTAGLAIGLALQDSLANVAGGFLIMFTKPLKVGDLVKFGDVTGTVKSVGILQTRLVLGDQTVVFIPNGQVAESVIVNYSEKEMRRLDLEIGISYDADFEKAKQVIAELIQAHPLAAEDPAPLVRVGRFDDSAVVLFVKVWTANDHYWDLHYDMHEQIKKAFDANGISMPYPQVDVHMAGKD